MPNPYPVRRTVTAKPRPDRPILPAGMSYRRNGLIHYKYTEHGRRLDVYGRTPEECLAKRWTPKPDPAAVVIDERTTLAGYLRLWLEGLELRPNTIGTHRHNVEHYLVPLFGERVRLAELTREGIRIKLAELRTRTNKRGEPIAANTVRGAYATLRRALATATDDGRLKANPAVRLNPTGGDTRATRVGLELAIPSELEMRRLRHHLAGDRDHALVMVAALTGLRQSELLGLPWSAVHLGERPSVHVSQTLRRTDRVIVPVTKNDGSSRYVPLGRVAVAILEELPGDRTGLVFTDEAGAPLVGSSVTKRFAGHCRAAGIRGFRWHDLRHSYASTLLNAGVSMAVVSKLLGHRDATITTRTYHHLDRGDELGTAAIAERAFG